MLLKPQNVELLGGNVESLMESKSTLDVLSNAL